MKIRKAGFSGVDPNVKSDAVKAKGEDVASISKKVEASSLDALNLYGKAGIKSKVDASQQMSVVTKEEVLPKLKEIGFEKSAKFLNTPERIAVAAKICSEPKIYEVESVKDQIDYILANSFIEVSEISIIALKESNLTMYMSLSPFLS